MAAGTEWSFVLDAPEQGADILGRMVPPEWSYARVLLRPLWDTLNMATLGTMIAVVLAALTAVLGTEAVTVHVRAVAFAPE